MAELVSQVRSDLQKSSVDGVCYSLMVGLGETYIPAFVLASGSGEVLSGLAATIPMLVGAILQLSSPWLVAHLRSHRRWVVLTVAAQAASFLPLLVFALLGGASAWLVFAAASLYWGAGLASGPAWNTWIGSLVPPPIRARYFALRTRALHTAALIGLLAGGALLQAGASASREMQAFALLFLFAGACRLISAHFLTGHSEPQPMPAGFRSVAVREMVRRLRASPDGKLLAYMLATQAAAQVAIPFFTPYMLREMRLSYGAYVALVAAALLGKMLALPFLGALAKRLGARRLLWIGGIGIVPVALPWIVTDSLPLLFACQLASGACWAAYELATFLLFFDHLPEQERTSVLTLFNVANSFTIAAGSLIGGALLRWIGPGPLGYAALFAVSSVLRLLALFLLRRVGEPELELPPDLAARESPRRARVATS